MNYMILCGGRKSDKDKFGTGFYISRYNMGKLLDFEPLNVRICKIWIKLNYILTITRPKYRKIQSVNILLNGCVKQFSIMT